MSRELRPSCCWRHIVSLLVLLSPTILGAKSIKDLNLPRPLPAFVVPITTFGQRPDWSPDGSKIVFLEKTCGDVYEVDLATREIIPLTHDFPHAGYTRALYLANGDILLTGSRTFDIKNPFAGRHEDQAEFWVMRPGSGKPPVPLGVNCREGPAVSRTQLRLNWALHDELHLADIVYDADDQPSLANHRVILTEKDLPLEGWHIEAQNFRPGAEHEIIFNMFDRDHNFLAEVMGLDLTTGKITNYSNRPDRYDEPEGIFPDGRRILVESSRQHHNYPGLKNFGPIDLWVLELDGTSRMTRLTYFNDDPLYKSSQGVISPNGRYMAFQISKTNDTTGWGYGILLMDIPNYLQSMGIAFP